MGSSGPEKHNVERNSENGCDSTAKENHSRSDQKFENESFLENSSKDVSIPINNDAESKVNEEELSLAEEFGCLSHNVVEQTEEFVRNIWNVCNFQSLPRWLQDNDYLHSRHRPPLNSFIECCKSVFRIHTETVNIWTHLLGCLLFICIYIDVLVTKQYAWQDKVIFAIYFVGTVICLGLSTAFHVLHCHSEYIGKLFNKLDYCGIAVLIMVSFVPWLYYCFYCHVIPIIVYMSAVIILGTASIIVSLWDKFAYPTLRPLRSAVFVTFGLSGIVPAMHFLYRYGSTDVIAVESVLWLSLMGALYIIGAVIYTLRVPERLFPGKCDILFQSHQIFHVFVLAAAFVHYYGITKMAANRLSNFTCKS